jgi:hypothetical protein
LSSAVYLPGVSKKLRTDLSSETILFGF